jgi:predicted  nucleic acid-binding Zn-ribbon protein
MARGSLDGRFRPVRRLEERSREVESPPTSETLQEIRAIDAEIARLEREMRAAGIDPQDTPAEVEAFFARFKGLTLDEKIEALEQEIAREEQEHGEP